MKQNRPIYGVDGQTVHRIVEDSVVCGADVSYRTAELPAGETCRDCLERLRVDVSSMAKRRG
jgi:hypothetical protein